jgi:hypothetical protein
MLPAQETKAHDAGGVRKPHEGHRTRSGVSDVPQYAQTFAAEAGPDGVRVRRRHRESPSIPRTDPTVRRISSHPP